MLERTVNLVIGKAYVDLRAALVDKGCKVLSEEAPKRIFVKQGSLWGITPKTAKKTVNMTLEPVDSGTRVTCYSKLASDWKNITLIGCFLAFAFVGICFWMATDLGVFMVTREPSVWSWIATVEGNVDLQVGQAFANLAWGLTVFLSVVILLEMVIAVYVSSKIDKFTQETINKLCVRN